MRAFALYATPNIYARDVVTYYRKKDSTISNATITRSVCCLVDGMQVVPRRQGPCQKNSSVRSGPELQPIVIIGSAIPVEEISGMDDRLISRFDSGLTVAVNRQS